MPRHWAVWLHTCPQNNAWSHFQVALTEALSAARSIREEFSRASALGRLDNPLAKQYQVVPKPVYRVWIEALPVLAAEPRPEFLRHLTALMPFILALTGDEAPQAAEGIYHTIQEVCEWWP